MILFNVRFIVYFIIFIACHPLVLPTLGAWQVLVVALGQWQVQQVKDTLVQHPNNQVRVRRKQVPAADRQVRSNNQTRSRTLWLVADRYRTGELGTLWAVNTDGAEETEKRTGTTMLTKRIGQGWLGGCRRLVGDYKQGMQEQ